MASSVDKKIIKQTKFPPEFNQKVDINKINLEVMRNWIYVRLKGLLGPDEDVVPEMCIGWLKQSRFPDIKQIQVSLTGFLEKDAPKVCKELWMLCLSAQENSSGVPTALLEAKKLELKQEKIKSEKAEEEARRRKEQERQRDRKSDSIRQRERGDRGRILSEPDTDRADRDDIDYGRRQRRISISPRPRNRSSQFKTSYRGSNRDIDTYIPSDRLMRRESRRRRSPSPRRSRPRSLSRSRTPPRRRHGESDFETRKRRFSRSRSPSPARRRFVRDRRRRSPKRDDYRARSFTPSETSRSRSPRRPERRRSPSIRSRSPIRRSQWHFNRRRGSPQSVSRSRSRSPDRERGRRLGNWGRPLPLHTSGEHDVRADDGKGQDKPDAPRYNRSRSRNRTPAQKSRSPTPSSHQERKRHRSIERYAPAARRQRTNSSSSIPVEKRPRTADSTANEEGTHGHEVETKFAGSQLKTTDSQLMKTTDNQLTTDQQGGLIRSPTYSQRLEKLLRRQREQLLASRKASK